MADPTGLVDLVNAAGYALRGRWAEAAVSSVAIVPYVGDVTKVGTVAKLAGAGARLAGRAGREDWVKLYRAVEPEELRSILQTRRYTAVFGGSEVKHFTLSAEEAAVWARGAY